MLMTYDQYLTCATEAYLRVQNAISKGRGNISFGEPGGFMENYKRDACVKDLRAAAKKDLSSINSGMEACPTEENRIKVYAKFALDYKCGNCEEFSALTFQILKTNGVRPLDWMKQEGYFGSDRGNHAFVIIGRDSATTAEDISTWNSQVVWCDAYERKIGGIKEIKERFSGERISLRYRWP